MLQRQCSQCAGLYTPVLGSCMIHCPMCEVAQRDAAAAAETYQRKLNTGDTSVDPTSKADAQRLSRAVTLRRKRHT